MRLSKSQYVLGRQCHKALWLYQHRKDLMEPPSARLQSVFDRGHVFGESARRQFPGGRLIAQDHTQVFEALRATEMAVEEGVSVLYEAAALFDDVLIRADVLEKRPDGRWDLIEVKSSRGLKQIYLHDLAIQLYVLKGLGFRMAHSKLMHCGPAKRDLRETPFVIADVTEDVERLLPAVAAEVSAMRAVVLAGSPPPIALGRHCDEPYSCRFKAYCQQVPRENSGG